jgi:hypothetical protein
MRDVDDRYTVRNYGRRERWGPYHRQAVRWLGRRLEQLGAWLELWSWGWGR